MIAQKPPLLLAIEIMKSIIGSLLVLLFMAGLVFGQETFHYSASGLAVEEPDKIKVLVEDPGEEGQAWGLTEQNIRTAIHKKLQSANIVPLAENHFNLPYWLYVEIQVLEMAFQVGLNFDRLVSYYVRQKIFQTFATVFIRESIGINTMKDGQHPLQILNELLDEFLVEFQKANRINNPE